MVPEKQCSMCLSLLIRFEFTCRGVFMDPDYNSPLSYCWGYCNLSMLWPCYLCSTSLNIQDNCFSTSLSWWYCNMEPPPILHEYSTIETILSAYICEVQEAVSPLQGVNYSWLWWSPSLEQLVWVNGKPKYVSQSVSAAIYLTDWKSFRVCMFTQHLVEITPRRGKWIYTVFLTGIGIDNLTRPIRKSKNPFIISLIHRIQYFARIFLRYHSL